MKRGNPILFGERKVNPLLTISGGLLGLVAAVTVFYFFAVSGEYDPKLIVFSFLPLAGILWFSTFDKNNQSDQENPDGTWNFGKTVRTSKYQSVLPTIDIWGCLLSILLAYFSIYLAEVLVVTNAYVTEYLDANFFEIFADVFVKILTVDWAREYLIDYWLGLTIVLVIIVVGSLFYYLVHRLRNPRERQLSDEEKAKLAYGAVLFTRNNLSFDHLSSFVAGNRLTVKSAKAMLANDWDIHNKMDVENTVESLLSQESKDSFDATLPMIQNGQADAESLAIYEELCQELTAHYGYTDSEIARVSTLSAWNYDRLVNLVRHAYIAKFITEEEMWRYIDRAIVDAKKYYQNWRQYFFAILLARSLYWGGNFGSNRIVAMKLLKNPKSIYQQFPMK